MCNCKDVDFGSYANQSKVDFPFYPATSVHENVCIDNCILEEVKQLWAQGIQTTNSCCGHNKLPGTILVIDEHIDKMLTLGYETYREPKVMKRPMDEDAPWAPAGQVVTNLNHRKDIFFAKSVERTPFDAYYTVVEW